MVELVGAIGLACIGAGILFMNPWLCVVGALIILACIWL